MILRYYFIVMQALPLSKLGMNNVILKQITVYLSLVGVANKRLLFLASKALKIGKAVTLSPRVNKNPV